MSDINLEGVVDLHIHTSPDVRPRLMDDIQMARAAAEIGMKAILLKSHHTLTADRASIAEKQVKGLRVFGSLALNHAVGGLNPAAVENALAFGAREIWMPTLTAQNHVRYSNTSGQGISILDNNNKMKPVVFDILELIAAADVILGTGHLSVEEIIRLVKAAHEMKVGKILITHPELPIVAMPLSIQQQLCNKYVFFERCFLVNVVYGIALETMIEAIKLTGVESNVMATDLGQKNTPSPMDGMRIFIKGFLENGLSLKDINQMTEVTPSHLLGIT